MIEDKDGDYVRYSDVDTLTAAAPEMLEALRMLITAWEDMHEESVAGIREHDLDIMNAAYGAAREAVDKAVASS